MVSFVLVAALVRPAWSGAQETVLVEDFVFVPDAVTVATAESVVWDWEPEFAEHNVREDHKLFRSGAPTANTDATFEVVFSAGTFHYYCEPHGSPTSGMDGLVRVRPLIEAPPSGPPFSVRWATLDTETGAVFDVRFKVGNGNWRTWLTDADNRMRVFGKDGKPVSVHPGTEFSFRVRSQKGAGTPNSVSRYSPVASFTP